jgi:hypothetical protein
LGLLFCPTSRLPEPTGVSFVEPVFTTGIGVIVSGLVPRNTRVNLHTKKAYIATIYNLMYLLLLRGAIIFTAVCFFIQMMPPGSAAAFRFYDYQQL